MWVFKALNVQYNNKSYFIMYAFYGKLWRLENIGAK